MSTLQHLRSGCGMGMHASPCIITSSVEETLRSTCAPQNIVNDDEAYAHGTLSTAGIDRASPAVRSLRKAVQLLPPAARLAWEAAAPRTEERPEPGTRPRQRHPLKTCRPELANTTTDIEGAAPCPKWLPARPRSTDPLCPVYALPALCTLPLPSGPLPSDLMLRDTLDVTDIAGMRRHEHSRAARAARAARSGSTVPSGPPLDVSDIPGSTPAWRLQQRLRQRAASVRPRPGILDTADINVCKLQPAPRESPQKGHPEGPRAPRRLQPRQDVSSADNSLRTLDIQGARLEPRRIMQPRMLAMCVADIDGASPADRDKTRLFQRKSAAAAAMTAQRTTAAALTSTLVLSPGELEDLWSSCRHYDRDGSGLLTPAEMERVLARGVPVLSSLDASRLVDALRDNAGLLRYGALVRQIKAQSLRPGSAPPLECRVAAGSKQQAPVAARHTAAEAATEPPTCQLQLPSCQSELGSAAQEPGNTFPPSSHAAAMFRPLSAPASAARSPGWQQQQHGQGATCTSWRPSTAVPAVTRSVLMPARCAVEWRGETSAAPPSQSSTSMSRRPRSACGVRLSALRKRDEADAADRAAVRLLQ